MRQPAQRGKGLKRLPHSTPLGLHTLDLVANLGATSAVTSAGLRNEREELLPLDQTGKDGAQASE